MSSNEWVYVTKEELNEFICAYPRQLDWDYYMDWWSWNDFSFGKWPESMVAMAQEYMIDKTYKIRRDVYETYGSNLGKH